MALSQEVLDAIDFSKQNGFDKLNLAPPVGLVKRSPEFLRCELCFGFEQLTEGLQMREAQFISNFTNSKLGAR